MDGIAEHFFGLGMPWWELVLRATVVYFAVLFMLRIAGKRTVGQFTPFDVVVIVLLGNAVQNALLGKDVSVLGGIILAGTLLALNWLVGKLSAHHKRFERVMEGRPVLLAREGEVFTEVLRRQSISDDEFEVAMRRADCRHSDEIDLAMLETSGDITVLKKR